MISEVVKTKGRERTGDQKEVEILTDVRAAMKQMKNEKAVGLQMLLALYIQYWPKVWTHSMLFSLPTGSAGGFFCFLSTVA